MHFVHKGDAIVLPLDIVEVAHSHSGIHLAEAFADILKSFDISDKVCPHISVHEVGLRIAWRRCLRGLQVLGVTCDNASNNDAMIKHLTELLPDFDGAPNRVRCFAHVLNLVAKSLIRQFDADLDKEAAELGADERELAELAEGLVDEERLAQAEDGGLEETDDPDDEVDAMKDMTAEQRAKFAEDVRPVKLVMAKVRTQPAVYAAGMITHLSDFAGPSCESLPSRLSILPLSSCLRGRARSPTSGSLRSCSHGTSGPAGTRLTTCSKSP